MKFKELNNKDKIGYIWDYYKIPIIVTICSVFAIISIAKGMIDNMNEVIAIDISYIGAYGNYEGVLEIQKEFEGFLIEQGIEGEVVLDLIDVSSEVQNESGMANIARLIGKTSTNEADIFIADEGSFAKNVEQGLFATLDLALESEELKASKERYFYYQAQSDLEEKVYAIDATNNSLLNKLVYDERKIYLTIYPENPHKETTIKVLNWILSKQ